MVVGIDLHLKMLKAITTIHICACTFGTPLIILMYFQLYRQGRRNALMSGQVNWEKNGGSGGSPSKIFFRFGALRGGSGDF